MALWQPEAGFRSGLDAVLLAAAVPARAGQTVLELGIGAGAATLCLAARVPGLALCGVEVQPDYAALARANAARNGADVQVVEADVGALPAGLRQRQFAHVFANPPYFDRRRGSAAPDAGRDIALAGATPAAAWVETAAARLAPKGWLTMIQKADRLPELLAAAQPILGSITVLPLAGRAGKEAGRIILWARKDGRAPFRLAAPMVLHEGPAHLRDEEDYTAQVREILRGGAGLPIPD